MARTDLDLGQLRIDRSQNAPPSARGTRRWRRWLYAFIALGVVVGGIFLLRDWLNPGTEVQLAVVSLTSPAQASSILTASGYVVARRKAAVASKGTGTLVYLGVEEGDKVKKGQVIARLEDSDVVASLQRARENLRVAEADLNDAKRSLDRFRGLIKDRVVAQSEYDAAEARYGRVIATIAASQSAVRESEVAVENTRIIAPFDGTVLKKNADVGEIVAPLAGAAAQSCSRYNRRYVVPRSRSGRLGSEHHARFPEQPCEIRLDAYPDRSYLGYVNKIVPTADRAKATVLVKIKFKDYDQRVLPDMGAKISFLSRDAEKTVGSNQPFLAVPASSVVTRDGRPVVFQVKENRAAEVQVATGRTVGSLIEVTRGLRNGEKIIAKPPDTIRDGSRVYLGSS